MESFDTKGNKNKGFLIFALSFVTIITVYQFNIVQPYTKNISQKALIVLTIVCETGFVVKYYCYTVLLSLIHCNKGKEVSGLIIIELICRIFNGQ